MTFPAAATSEDIAMLLADEKGASLIVAVGTHATLVEFLDKGRGGMASTFLTRLKVGGKLVDAKGVSRLYRQNISGSSLLLLVLVRDRGDGVGGGGVHRRQGLSRRGRPSGGTIWSSSSDSSSRRPTDQEALGVINFRYHVVSLTAVFLALAIGLVVGTAALNGPVADSLKEQVDALRKDNQQLREQVDQPAARRLNREEDFAAEAAPVAARRQARPAAGCSSWSLPVGQRLRRRRRRDARPSPARRSPARSTCRTSSSTRTNNDELLDLADTGAAADACRPPALPRNSDGVETSSALLASVLLRPAARRCTAEPT